MGKILETAMFAYESGADNYVNKIRTEKVISEEIEAKLVKAIQECKDGE